jgi:uncharacterized membrane protein YfcA
MLTLLYGALVGLSLGLTGGGGSIFAVPLLVYGLSLDFRKAVALSLIVVGSTALYGAVLQARKRNVLWRAGALVGLGGVVSAPLGALIGARTPERLSLLLFALIMTVVGVQMLRGPIAAGLTAFACEHTTAGGLRFSLSCAAKLFFAGLGTGILSGIFGVGGGFLLVPALLIVAALPVERAMATSLVAIFLISLSGFIAHIEQFSVADAQTALMFLLGSGLGMTIGAETKAHFSSTTLRRMFGALVLSTAAFVVLKNIGS